MGNQNKSQQFQNANLEAQLLEIMKKNPFNNFGQSFLNEMFLNNLKENKKDISRNGNPFCPLQINMGRLSCDDEWKTCCMISPILAIASPTIICDQNSQYCWQARLSGSKGNSDSFYIKITDVIMIQEQHICLLVLEKPVLQLGWAGLSYLQNQKDIQTQSFYTVNHPKRILDQDTDLYNYIQRKKSITYENQGDFFGFSQQLAGSIIFKIQNDKPYVVGIQIHNRQARFFNKSIFDKIKSQAKNYFNQKKLKEISEQIHWVQYQDLSNYNNSLQ